MERVIALCKLRAADPTSPIREHYLYLIRLLSR